ncbi:hypothetical protein [Conexibacter arvalis]|uniref:Integral membrane protein n=1 Tax=Conexibacter arvalis TaxID=912552 RepID=A0A840IG42_9ACTN|nr:hypothetical protein [Conexibacter arvalis]MBB4663211.1 hypothetical protein [Conexibacter arvalis]
MLAFLVFAAEGAADHGSQTPFYVAGAVLAAWAVLVGGIGVLRPAFADGEGVARTVLAGTAVLVGVTIAMAIVTAN